MHYLLMHCQYGSNLKLRNTTLTVGAWSPYVTLLLITLFIKKFSSMDVCDSGKKESFSVEFYLFYITVQQNTLK